MADITHHPHHHHHRLLPLLPLLFLLGGLRLGGAEISSFFDPLEDRWLELYPGEELTGEPTTLTWGTPRLEGPWGSLRQSGIWILYSEPDYLGANVTVAFGEVLEMNIRHPVVGPDEDDVRVPNFHNFGTDAKSLIGVGSDWTLFNGPNFNGPNCTCLQLTHFSMSSYDGDNAMLAATFHPYLTPDDAPVAYTSPVGQISPVGSAILTCRNVPMRKLCAKLPWENVHRSQCPILSRGVKVCESEVVGWF
ncbi:uncharacterized protein LOC127006385 isoform X2 [Eriocheir sinensis]|uniref:uncharacterized protein LOC127006385 isoform X2 n=1 Tax=Eriocheir sinensis TaxID=95602 RepID=UPI0021C6E2D3|nr:uncharacterized protein LOC127006385 isoform X2 [Eriocheir sinensis]